MEIKNKFAVIGFMLVFANLGSVTAQADQSGLSANGEFVTISAEASGKVNLFPHPSEVDSIYEESREKLDKEALEACSGRAFSVDDSSIEYTGSYKPGTRIFIVRATARAFCIASEQ